MSRGRCTQCGGPKPPGRGRRICDQCRNASHLRCSRCREVKPAEAFYRSSSKATGRQTTCKSCQDQLRYERYEPVHEAQLRRRRYLANRDVARAYHRDWYARNAESQRQRSARWKALNPEKVRAQVERRDRTKEYATSRRYRARNPEWVQMVRQLARARRRAAVVVPIAKERLAEKWAYWSGRCWMCGTEADTWDHVKPITRGGFHCLANLRPACRSCNSRKNNTWPWPRKVISS